VAVLSVGCSQRRFGAAADAIGQPILINNEPFTVIGVTPADFFGADPAAAPNVYLPMHANIPQRSEDRSAFADANYRARWRYVLKSVLLASAGGLLGIFIP
jgi:hypothetical protein